MGAQGFEFDVRRSGDGRLVVVHDARWEGRQVSATPAAALGRPLLEDVLREFRHAWLDIELKVPGMEAQVLELAARYLAEGRYVLTSFHAGVIGELKRLSPRAPVGLLFQRPLARWNGMDLDYLAPQHRLLTARLARAARARGLRLIAWTVNTPAAMRRVLALGVDVVVTDYPERWTCHE